MAGMSRTPWEDTPMIRRTLGRGSWSRHVLRGDVYGTLCVVRDDARTIAANQDRALAGTLRSRRGKIELRAPASGGQ